VRDQAGDEADYDDPDDVPHDDLVTIDLDLIADASEPWPVAMADANPAS